MEYALLYRDDEDPEPYDASRDDIGDWVDRLEASGAAEYGQRLRPERDATTVRVRCGELLVSDGPFTESKEAVGGFDVIDVPSLDEAVEIAARHPAARFGKVEIRPFRRWPDWEPGFRIVPADFDPQPAEGRVRYVLFVVADPAGEPGDEDPDAWVAEMDARGARRFGEVLRPPADATIVRTRGADVLVTDGPLSEAKEWIAGFDLLEVRGLSEAIEVASKHPMARGGTLELRPVWPFDEHGDQVARAASEAGARDVRTEPSAARALAEVAR